jgi:hypothetical protein
MSKGLAAPAGAGPGPDCDRVQPDLTRRVESPCGLPFRLPGEGRTEPAWDGECRFSSTLCLSMATMSIHSLSVCRRNVHPTVVVASHTVTGLPLSKFRRLTAFARSAIARTGSPGAMQMAWSTTIAGELRALRFGWGTPRIVRRCTAAGAVSAFRVLSVASRRILDVLFCVWACMPRISAMRTGREVLFVDLMLHSSRAEDFWVGYKLFCYVFYSNSSEHEADFRESKLG